MKKLIYLLTTTIVLGLSSASAIASTTDKVPAKEQTLSPEQQVQLQKIEQRVLEIKAMDKSDLSRAERKALKKELRDMNKQAAAVTGGGVYLSVGAIIIIILVLIILL